MVLANSKGVPRVPSYLGYKKDALVFDYRTFTFFGTIFHLFHLTNRKLNKIVPQPSKIEFRLIPFRSPLLRESLLLSFPLVTKMFQFTRFALSSLFDSRSSSRSFLIRVFSDQNLLPVPRNISLVATPFIASEHQGIRRKLLIA